MIKNKSLKGHIAIVCGASKGIGAAAAIELSKYGVSIILIARNQEALNSTIQLLDTSLKQNHDLIVADFSNPEILRNKIETYIENKSIEVNILINNTGGPKPGPIIDASPADFINAFNQHLICNHILVNAVLDQMIKNKYGRIINIISTSVKQPIKGLGVSNTIRGAVASWAKTLSFELGEFGITVNNILPGYTDTERLYEIFEKKSKLAGINIESIIMEAQSRVPLKRFANPIETAKAICFLASPESGYINGINLPVDGGRLSSL